MCIEHTEHARPYYIAREAHICVYVSRLDFSYLGRILKACITPIESETRTANRSCNEDDATVLLHTAHAAYS